MESDAFRLQHLIACLDAETGSREVADDLLRGLGVDRGITRQEDVQRTRAEPLFLDAACAHLKDPLFAARAGLQLRDSSTLNGYIAKHSKNLRKAVENSSRYYALFEPAFEYDLKVSGNVASFRVRCLDPDFGHFHRHLEFLVFTFLKRGRALTGVELKPLEIRFTHRVVPSRAAFETLSGCPVLFGTEETEILMPLRVLDIPIPTFDPNLRGYLMAYGDKVLQEKQSGPPGLAQQVKATLAERLPGELAPAEDVAVALGMSRRTFTRRLAAENLTFRGIVDELRCDMAKAYLSNGLGIAEIAFLLGYADQAAFTTAFKRWTGLSPGSWRSGGVLSST